MYNIVIFVKYIYYTRYCRLYKPGSFGVTGYKGQVATCLMPAFIYVLPITSFTCLLSGKCIKRINNVYRNRAVWCKGTFTYGLNSFILVW